MFLYTHVMYIHVTYWILFIESFIASFKEIELWIVESGEGHTILLSVNAPHES